MTEEELLEAIRDAASDLSKKGPFSANQLLKALHDGLYPDVTKKTMNSVLYRKLNHEFERANPFNESPPMWKAKSSQ
jgi:hypothetical protein